jgi:hypothetical protein
MSRSYTLSPPLCLDGIVGQLYFTLCRLLLGFACYRPLAVGKHFNKGVELNSIIIYMKIFMLVCVLFYLIRNFWGIVGIFIYLFLMKIYSHIWTVRNSWESNFTLDSEGIISLWTQCTPDWIRLFCLRLDFCFSLPDQWTKPCDDSSNASARWFSSLFKVESRQPLVQQVSLKHKFIHVRLYASVICSLNLWICS